MSTERNRKQNARLIATGARLKLEGVIHVQGRGWAHSSTSRALIHEPGMHPDQVATAGQALVRADRVTSPAAEDEGLARYGTDSMGARIARNMDASRDAAYAGEELAKRMEHLLAQR